MLVVQINWLGFSLNVVLKSYFMSFRHNGYWRSMMSKLQRKPVAKHIGKHDEAFKNIKSVFSQNAKLQRQPSSNKPNNDKTSSKLNNGEPPMAPKKPKLYSQTE